MTRHWTVPCVMLGLASVFVLRPAPASAHRGGFYHHHHGAHYAYTHPPRWGVGLHLGGVTTNHRLADEAVALGGGGAHLRFRHAYWGAELSFDVLGNRFGDGAISRLSVPVQANAMFFVNPRGPLQVYLLGGLRAVPTHVRWDLPNLQKDQSFFEAGGQVGVGLELQLGRFLAVSGDVRGFATVRNGHDEAGAYYDNVPNVRAVVPEKTAGLQFNLGATVRF